MRPRPRNHKSSELLEALRIRYSVTHVEIAPSGDTQHMTQAESPINDLTYVEYRENLEHPDGDEEQLIDKIIASLRENNERAFKKYKKGIRDAHAKSHGILRGEMTVLPDLPEHLRQGVFATPKTYTIIARLSTTSGALRSDQVRGVRGLGLKVLEVDGDRLIEDGETTQDFVFVTEPRFPFKDTLEYSQDGMRSAKMLSYLPDIGVMGLSLFLRGAGRVLSLFGRKLPFKYSLFAKPNTLTLGETFYTAAPLQYGKYVAKLSVAPLSDSVTALTGKKVGRGHDAHTAAVVEFFKNNTAGYLVSAQLCTDTKTMPIEDATTEWPTDESPYQPVAKITYGRQDAHSTRRQEWGDDELSFNSWRAIADHKPLGSINRLKRRVYDASSDFRHTKNNKPQIEPRVPADIPS
jgi:hypothetical protein